MADTELADEERWPTTFEHLRWRLRNPWTWPVLFQVGCWWEKRYRPERWQWREGAIVICDHDFWEAE